jgi:serine/threonine-protein kinase
VALHEQLQAALGGGYTLERELGGGGMSRVFVAEEKRFRRKVVVKVLAPQLAAGISAERFEREIQLAAQLQHPQIVPVHAAGEVGGLPFYTMPFIEGQSLRSRLAQGSLSCREAIEVLRDVAKALAYAHGRGVVHRDVKPDNVLLAGDSAMVTDFGIAKAITAAQTVPPDGASATLTQAGVALGTPAYMAPEQAAADPTTDHRADLYAFGCMAYELLTGATPFGTGPAPQLFVAHLTEAPTPIERADVPRELASLVMRCLEKDPDKRLQSAYEAVRELDAVATTRADGAARPSQGRSVAAAATVVVALGMLGWAARHYLRVAPAHPRVIAVLPFENVGDTTVEYLSDGMTDELASALADVPGLRVVARSSAYAFKGKHASLQEVGRALRADAVLGGSVRTFRHRFRVTAELSGTSDGLSLWSYTNERETKDIFAVQSQITGAIVAALKLKLQGAVPPAGRHQTSDPEAHDLYLRGRFLANSGTRQGLFKSLEYYHRALAKDSNYALADVGIAETYLDLSDQFVSPSEAYPKALEASNRALAHDSALGEAWSAAANITISWRREWQRGRRQIERAQALNPSDSWVYVPESFYWAAMRQPRRMLESMRRVLLLDPLSPIWNDFAEWEYVLAGQPDSAITLFRRTVDLAPNHAYLDSFVGYAYLEKGMTNEAEREFNRVEPLLGHRSPGLALAYARTGHREEALAVLKEIEQHWSRAYVVPELIAQVYAALGDAQQMYAWLEKGVEAPSFAAVFIGLLPSLRPYWEEPRFKALLHRLGMPEHPGA